jgi:cytochrome c-type biogenesis protein CcmF
MPLLGQLLLLASAFCHILQAAGGGRTQRFAALAAGGAALAAFGLLVYLFATSDYSVLAVYRYSHSLTPFPYKIAAAWGNHEGSLLLLLALIGLYGGALALLPSRLPEVKQTALRVMGTAGLAFDAYVFLLSNPFETQFPVPSEGSGFNPLLQDVGLAIHPPVLYVGYIGLLVPYALALAGLKTGALSRPWGAEMRNWTLFSWTFLTAGIALGSWWAYRELGWGGFWFWDPVENASLMPWLGATALLHSACVSRNAGRCLPWTAALALLSFWLAVAGFFLVRSGIVTSVHAFASAPERGVYILGMMLACGGAGVVALARLLPRGTGEDAKGIGPRAGGIAAQNVWMCVALSTLLLGTIYPLLLEAFAGRRISVGAPYFNTVFMYLGALLAVFMALLPGLPAHGALAPALRRLLPAWGAAFLACLAVLAAALPDAPLAFSLLFSLAAAGIAGECTGMFRAVRQGRVPSSVWRMHLAHAGLFTLLAGVALASFLQREREFAAKPGETLSVAGFRLTFDRMERERGENYLALRGVFSAYDGDAPLGTMAPEARFYPVEGQQTAEAALVRLGAADLYLSMGDALPNGEAGLRLQYKPGVPLIWLGASMAAMAGLAGVLSGKRWTRRKKTV